MITSPMARFPLDVQDDILDALHHRHNQVFTEGGNLYSPVYLAAAYLNPGKPIGSVSL